MRLSQPPNTTKYDVKSSDTIASISLRYNTTPTELSRLNHLSSSLLFPGQTLFVPDKLQEQDEEVNKESNTIIDHKVATESIVILQSPKSPKSCELPIIREMAFSPDHNLNRLLDRGGLHSSGDEVSEKYLKLKSKYVTDGQGVVSGVLLVTPQTVMFNPNVSDHLVMDRGREMYAVRLPLKAIANLNFFEDIAAMVTDDASQQYMPAYSFIDYDSINRLLPKPGMIVCENTGEEFTLLLHNKKEHSDSEISHLKQTLENLNIEQLENLSPKRHVGHETVNTGHTNEGYTDQGINSLTDSLETTVKYQDKSILSNELGAASIEEKKTEQNQDVSVFMKERNFSSTPKHLPYCNMENTENTDQKTQNTDTNTQNTEQDLIERTDNLIQNADSSFRKNDFHPQSIPCSSNLNNEPRFGKTGKTDQKNCSEIDIVNKKENIVSPFSDLSKDSGISEINVTHFSHQDSHDAEHHSVHSPKLFLNNEHRNCLGKQDVNMTHFSHQDSHNTEHPALSPKSSLSNEHKLWLGKRGVVMPSLENKNDISSTSTEPEGAENITPRPASRYKDTLMYVAIKVHKSYWFPTRMRLNAVMGMPPNRDQKRRQHWFAVPKERVDQLYGFLLHWAPEMNVFASGMSTPCNDAEEVCREGLNIVEDKFANSPASMLGYEKLSQDDAASMKFLYQGSVSSKGSLRSLYDEEIPELLAESQLLSRKQIHHISSKLPSRTVGHSWELVYSTTVHGISLSTLYRNFRDYDTPVLLAVKDENERVFGAFVSEPPKISDGFYGTGESFLWSFGKDNILKVYRWSGENVFFLKGSKTSLAIGGGDGLFGLWLDEDIYRGRSHSCRTFESETLSGREDFICTGLEAWAFI